MFIQFYKLMIVMMLIYLKKFLINNNNIKFMIFILDEIQRKVQNIKQKIIFINYKINTFKVILLIFKHFFI